MKPNNRKRMACLLALALCLMAGPLAAMAETISVTLPVQVSVTGSKPPSTSSFSFVLVADKADYPMPKASVLTIPGAGKAAFGPIVYEEPNDYTYTLYQAAGGITGYTYDTQVYHVTVQVTSDAQGQLYATVSMKGSADGKPDKAIFVNHFRLNTDIPKTGYGEAACWPWLLLMALGLAGAACCWRQVKMDSTGDGR